MPRSPPNLRSKVRKPTDKKVQSALSVLSESSASPPPPTMATGLSKSDIEIIIKNCFDQDSVVDKLVTKLADKVKCAVVDALSASLKQAEQEIKTLKNDMISLRTEVKEMKSQLAVKDDDLEQYTRRNSIRVFGIPESERENTDDLVVGLFREKLRVDVPVASLDRTHRVGRQLAAAEDGTPRGRPIIVKFVSYRDRRKIFDSKKLLKGTGITIREDLTPRRMEVFRAACDKFGHKNTWTLDGRVLWLDGNGRKGMATNLSDLAKH